MVVLVNSFFIKFFNSFNFYFVLTLSSILFLVFYSFSVITFSLILFCLVAFLKFFYLSHGIFGFIHVVEDYIFNNVCKYFYVILLFLILLRGVIFLI